MPFSNVPVSILMIKTPLFYQPIPSNLVSKWRGHSHAFHYMLSICLISVKIWHLYIHVSVQELFCRVYIILSTFLTSSNIQRKREAIQGGPRRHHQMTMTSKLAHRASPVNFSQGEGIKPNYCMALTKKRTTLFYV